jgi:hypothetical protein
MLIDIIDSYNFYLLEVRTDIFYINIGTDIFIFIGVTLALAIYQTITNKNQNRIA